MAGQFVLPSYPFYILAPEMVNTDNKLVTLLYIAVWLVWGGHLRPSTDYNRIRCRSLTDKVQEFQ